MATVGLESWVNTVVGRLSGAQREMVETEAVNALRDFFTESTVWRVDLQFDARKEEKLYDLTAMLPDASPLFIHRAFYKSGSTDRYLNPIDSLPFDRDYLGDPINYWSPQPGLFRPSPIPDEDKENAFRLWISLQPDLATKQVPDWVERQFFKGILDGILSRMYLHPKRPYSSAVLGERHSNSYTRQVTRARAMVTRRFTSAPNSFRFPGGWSPVI